jgi:DNA-directed RNA polymerase subunit H (RpoH/RPB5)
MNLNGSFIKQLYVSRSNLVFYLKNAGFDCKQIENASIEDMEHMKTYNQLDFKVTNPITNESCYILYKLDENFKQNIIKRNNIEQCINEIYDELKILDNKDTLIIVTNEYTKESVNKILKNVWEKESKYVVVFTLSNLQTNILLHSYVPKHIRLNTIQKDELYKQYNLSNDKQLPEISRFDPVSKVIFLRPNEVCEIIRYDKISLMNKYYRVCIS